MLKQHTPAHPGLASARRSICIAALAVVLVGLTPGCVAVIAGTGAGAAVAFSLGRLDAVVPADLGRTHKASVDAISQLQFARVSEKSDALGAVLIARTSGDKRIRIELSKETDQVTRIWIRVGVFGDEAVSLAILDRIKSNLGT
jgi:hypothetical protein